MGDTKIEWAEKTWNPIRAELLIDIIDKLTGKIIHKAGEIGWFCIKCSPGCAGCYACSMNLWRGNGLEYTVPNRENVRMFLDEKTLLEPLKWRTPKTVFPCSMTDWMEESLVPDEWIDKMLAVMALTPQHTYLTLTKRADRQRKYFNDEELAERIGMDAGTFLDGDWIWNEGRHFRKRIEHIISLAHGLNDDCETFSSEEFLPLKNLWAGVSVENPDYLHRINDLANTPAFLRWVSFEPLLGDLGDIRKYLEWIGWAVCGGESGPKARPMHPDWARSIRDQCKAAKVPFFFKQWGSHFPHRPLRFGADAIKGRCALNPDGTITTPDCCSGTYETIQAGAWEISKCDKKASGRLLDGVEHNEYPNIRKDE